MSARPDTPTLEFVGNSRVRGARSPPGTHRDLTTPSSGTVGRRRCAPAAGRPSGGSVCPARVTSPEQSGEAPHARTSPEQSRKVLCPGGLSQGKAEKCAARRTSPEQSGKVCPGGSPGGVPAAGFRAAVCPPGQKNGFFSVFFPALTRMYKEARPSFSEKKKLTFRPGRVMYVSAGLETTQKAHPGGWEKPPPGERSTPHENPDLRHRD